MGKIQLKDTLIRVRKQSNGKEGWIKMGEFVDMLFPEIIKLIDIKLNERKR